jgi:hypothetical protein
MSCNLINNDSIKTINEILFFNTSLTNLNFNRKNINIIFKIFNYVKNY